MAYKENPFARYNPTFITNGRLKRQSLEWGQFKVISNKALLGAIDGGEQKLDKALCVGMMTSVPHYPLAAALAKAMAAQPLIAGIDNLKDSPTIFGTFDSTYAFEASGKRIYLNKPAAHPDGAGVGVREMMEFLTENPTLKLNNVSGVVFFDPKDILGGMIVEVSTGQINPLNTEQVEKAREIIYANRSLIAGGINTLIAWQEGIVAPPALINLRITEVAFHSNFLRQFEQDPNIYQPWISDFKNDDLEREKMPPGFNEIFIGLLYGVLPKGLLLPTNS